MICNNCNHTRLKNVMNIKNLPISNYYNSSKSEFNIKNYNIFSCRNCSLIQVKNNFSLDKLIPKNKKIKQNEPEEHLDKLVSKIIKKKFLNKSSNILCLSYKDSSLAERFKKKGYLNVEILNYKKFFNSNKVFFENIEKFNNKKYFEKFSKKKKYDLIIGRHIIEHFFYPKKFIQNLKIILNSKNGYIYLEIPDSLKSLKNFDYNMLWEQHKMYFTKSSLIDLMNNTKFKKVFCDDYKYKYENCILFLGRLTQKSTKTLRNFKKKEYNYSSTYFSNFSKIKKKIQLFFKQLKKNGNIVIYGAGHQTTMYLHLFNLAKYVSYIVDDNKNYNNKFLPGTKIKILKKNNQIKFKHCLISANHNNELKIIKNNSIFFKNKNILSISFFNKKIGSKKYI